jgi:uncharacterized delta-60 repeat protein
MCENYGLFFKKYIILLGILSGITACSGGGSSASLDNDTTAPAVTAASDSMVPAKTPRGSLVSYTACTAVDAIDTSPVITYSKETGTVFPLGTTTVICTATDTAGNAGSDTFNIVVADTAAPTVTAPSDISVNADTLRGTSVSYTACTAVDAVDDSPVITYSLASASTFPVGINTVTCTATDNTGNVDSASFDITVSPYTDADTSFGSPNGYVINDAAGGSSGDESIYGITIDNSGNIVAVGDSSSPSALGIMWRYQPDATLDTSFNSNGIVIISDGAITTHQYVRDVAVDANDRLVVAGHAQVGPGSNVYPAIWRYNTTGTLDTSFDNDGFAYFDMSPTYQSINVRNMTIDADDRILLVGDGYNTINSKRELLVWRYTSSGTLDTTFCNRTGYCVFTSDITPNGEAYGYDIVTDGTANERILLTGGIAYNPAASYSTDVVVIRLDTSGSLDTSFGSDGVARFSGPDNNIDQGTALKLDGDGKIVVTGFSRSPGTDDDVLLLRFNTDGSLDTSFDTDGYIILSNANRDRSNDLEITASGQILLLGKKNRGGTDNNNSDLAVWRFNTDGSLDTTFGSNGVFLLQVAGGGTVDYSATWGGIMQDANGRAVIAGASNNGSNLDMTIWRLK